MKTNHIYVGDCKEVMQGFPEDSIDLVVTSPPYWGLRDYGNEEQLGLEHHPQLYVDNLVDICREIKRVLKPEGSFWLNLGDTYYGSGKGAGGDIEKSKEIYQLPKESIPNQSERSNWLQPKQLLGIPWRVATALQEDGWILRNCVIWYKPNHMPESVKDRLTKSYEFFFFFVKSRKYYFDLDSIREPLADVSITRMQYPRYAEDSKGDTGKYGVQSKDYGGKYNNTDAESIGSPRARMATRDTVSFNNPKGKNPGDMWSISTQSFPGSHFAVFPEKLIEPIIKSSSPKDGVVLDPFCGSGTTCYAARKLGRRFIGIELNEEYAEMARERVRGRTFKRDLSDVKKLTSYDS